MVNMEARTVARAFYGTWIARYGAPELISTDQGKQFEDAMFAELLKFLGVARVRTAGYHPQSNGLIERFHRDLKAALMCFCDSPSWVRFLPSVMLGMRTRIRLDVDASPAEFVFGTVLRIPGEFCVPGDLEPNGESFLLEYREHMKSIKPVPVSRKYNFRPFVFKELNSCSHVMMKAKPIKPSLNPPYLGPFKVLKRFNDRNYEIEINGTPKVVSTERLKPAHYISPETVETFLGTDRPTDTATQPAIAGPSTVCHPVTFRAALSDPIAQMEAPTLASAPTASSETPPSNARPFGHISNDSRIAKQPNEADAHTDDSAALQARARSTGEKTYTRKRVHFEHNYARPPPQLLSRNIDPSGKN